MDIIDWQARVEDLRSEHSRDRRCDAGDGNEPSKRLTLEALRLVVRRFMKPDWNVFPFISGACIRECRHNMEAGAGATKRTFAPCSAAGTPSRGSHYGSST